MKFWEALKFINEHETTELKYILATEGCIGREYFYLSKSCSTFHNVRTGEPIDLTGNIAVEWLFFDSEWEILEVNTKETLK